MTPLCEQCGSIRIARVQSTFTDKVVAMVTSRRPFQCRRCGWRQRRNWTDADFRKLHDYGAGGAEPDPSLTVLDVDLHQKRKGVPEVDAAREPRFGEFDIDAILPALDDALTAKPELGTAPAIGVPRRRRSRRTRGRGRRRVLATITAGVAFLVLLALVLGLTVVIE